VTNLDNNLSVLLDIYCVFVFILSHSMHLVPIMWWNDFLTKFKPGCV